MAELFKACPDSRVVKGIAIVSRVHLGEQEGSRAMYAACCGLAEGLVEYIAQIRLLC